MLRRLVDGRRVGTTHLRRAGARRALQVCRWCNHALFSLSATALAAFVHSLFSADESVVCRGAQAVLWHRRAARPGWCVAAAALPLAPAEAPRPTGPCPPAARGILATRRPTRANYRRHAGACAGGAQKLLLARQSGSIVVVSASWRVHRGRPRALPLGRGGGGGARCPPRIARVPRLAPFPRLFARRVYDSIARKQLADHRLERYAVA